MIIYDVLAESENADARTVGPNQTLRQVAHGLLEDAVGALAVADDDENLIGVITERAVMNAIMARNNDVLDQPVSTLMTQATLTCAPEDEIDHVLSMMSAQQVLHAPVVEDGKAVGLVGILELTQAFKLLGVQADKDPLTNLPNRDCFVDHLVNEIERCNRYRRALSVARVDIDGFDRIVNEHGRDAGDKVVLALSELFFNDIRNVDYVGRVGEEKFAVYFPETDLNGAEVACNRLMEKVRAAKIDIGSGAIQITVSIGVTELAPNTAYSLGILNRADQLLCQARAEGVDRVQRDPGWTEAKADQVA